MHPNRKRAPVNDFDGHLLFELRIRSLGEVYLAHAAGTQRAQYSIRPYAISHHF
jgi:hypothetical protein